LFGAKREYQGMASDRQRLILLLNESKLQTDKQKKLTQLAQIEEILIHQPNNLSLLSAFLPNVLEFHLDNAPQVRKYLVGFIEQAVKADPRNCLVPSVETLLHLSNDVNVNVVKRVISAASLVFSKSLQILYD
jgi:hypothetical protein